MKVRFLTPLRIEKIQGKLWRVIEAFCCAVDEKLVTVPAGYVSDMASVPRLPFVYLAAGDTVHESAVLHDYLYEEQVDRAWADAVFLAAMETEGVSWLRRQMMYRAVRAFGGSRYAERETVEDVPPP